MIKYNEIQNKYKFNPSDIDKIIELIKNGKYYDEDNCTQEKVGEVISSVDSFISNLEVSKEEVTLERHETEEEARNYFGENFILEFDNLLTRLDKEETIVAIHGTSENVCPLILENGLQYKFPSLSSTAVSQQMNYGQGDMHYNDYEGLLNWGHKEYKGLVILAIPYECFYKEGLWNNFQNTDSSAYGGQDYKIDSDFVVGYIDVNDKKIIMNPKYNRHHNYENYVHDQELFREQPNMDNQKLKESIIESESKLESKFTQIEEKEEEFDVSRIPYFIEDLIGTFNSLKFCENNIMDENRYKYFLEQLNYEFNYLKNNIHLLKTDEQVRLEQEEKFKTFDSVIQSSEAPDVWDDFELDHESNKMWSGW